MDEAPGLKKTKSIHNQEPKVGLGTEKLSLGIVLSSLILPGIFGLLFTGIPQYVGFYMQVYLVFMAIDAVVGLVLAKTQKGPRDLPVARYIFFQGYFAGIWTVLGAWRVVNFQIGLGIIYWGIFLSAFVIGKLFGTQITNAIIFPERTSKRTRNITNIVLGVTGSLAAGGYGMIRMVNFFDPHSANAILSVVMLLFTSLMTLMFFSISSGGKKKKRLELGGPH